MKWNLRRIIFSILIIFSINIFHLKSIKRDAEDVFDRIFRIQLVLDDINLTEMKKYLSEVNITSLQNNYQANLSFFKSINNFFELPVNEEVQNIFLNSNLFSNKVLLQRYLQLYDLMENDFSGFISDLCNGSFSKGRVNSEESKIFVDILLSKYWGLVNPLFMQKDSYKNSKFLTALGNRFFEFCFYDKTFLEYKNILLDKDLHPIAKFLNTVIWKTLISYGWKYWHKDCLSHIKEKTDNGAELVYIAGGCDIYHLIKNGIYNIRIIDPFLPTQVRYYSSGWGWFANLDLTNDLINKIGDEIEFNFEDNKILLRRIEHKRLGEMFIKFSTGQSAFFPESRTIWIVVDRDKNKKLGRIIIERREAVQEDFVEKEDQVLVMSCTEMISAIDLPEFNGWGIDAHKIDNNLPIFIKQLRKPINGKVLKNIRFACEHQADLEYITLASDPR
ncbi:hypothetical protein ACFLYH_01220 [Candidatus Dependentiae bacterium]